MASMMTSMSFDLSSRKEVDISDLQAQVKGLQSELTQCQADKEFVWSLWKRLQVSNPDVTEAISLVIQREKEKAEAKDLKVLEILQIKDDRIEELQNIVSKQTQEIGDLLSKKVDLQDQCGRMQMEVDATREKLSSSQIQIQQLENRERSITDIQRQSMESSEQDKYGLQRKIVELTSELEDARLESQESMLQKRDLENKIRTLEREMSSKVSKFDDLVKDFEDAKTQVCLLTSESQQQQREINYKSRELETIRKELAELWTSHNQLTDHSSQQAQLIRQLQSLHQDTQRMMKNQEDAFSMEAISIQQMYTDLSSRYERLKKTETDLRHEIVALKKELLEKDDMISQLQGPASDNKYGTLGGSFLDFQHEADPVVDYEYKIRNLQEELKSLRKKLQEKEKIISHFEQMDDQSVIFDVDRLNSHERTHSTPARVLHSPKLSPRLTPREARASTRECQLAVLRRKLADNEHLLELKSRELSELHKAHAKRLERLRGLQHNYRLVREQLKTLEEEQGRKKKKPRRSDPRDLQKENSDAVWNELAFFKNENKSLQLEKLSMQEELDMLHVEIAQNAATAYELKVKLEQEREEFAYQLRRKEVDNKVKSDIESEMTILKSSVQSKDISLQKMDRTLREIVREKEILLEENRKLKTENVHVQQESAQYRIQIADLSRDVQRYKRDLDDYSQSRLCIDHLVSSQQGRKMYQPDVSVSESAVDARRNRSTSRHTAYRIQRRNRSRLARKYQAALNRSIEKMSSMFEHFNEEGWEEITDTPGTEEDTEMTESDTLGQTIVSVSRQHDSTNTRNVTSSVMQAVAKNQIKAKHNQPRRRWVLRAGPSKQEKSSSSETLPRSTPERDIKIFRDSATSPISFASPLKDKPKKAVIPPSRQIGPLKQRVGYLQQQLITLRNSRANALKNLSEEKDSNQQLKTDLNLANQRIRLAKVTIQKLSGDVERCQKEKSELEQRLASRDELSSTASTLQEKHNDQEWKVLEARLKVSTCEVSRQSSTIRNLKTENESLQDQIRSLQDRLNHMERDNNQKRTLVENHRVKLKQLQESAKSDANVLSDLETKVKLLTDNNDKCKVQVESLKKRLSVVTKEKKEYEEQYQKISADLEKKSNQLTDCRAKCSELESAISELEHVTKQQLQGLVSQSEAAIETAHEKLATLQSRILQYEQFVKMLGNELLRNVQHTREQLKQTLAKKKREAVPVDSSLQKAQSVARNILNLSQSDIDDIMSADGDHDEEMDSASEMEKKNDKKWAKKCEKLLSSKDFVASLVKHFLQKIDEREVLAAAVIG
ncbi:centlein-like isoform X2 [Gigantopelta aegis]|uniref:centlein-like isoform X2 n=1 Tax=Gigantopelta aegis TaxID=1735272 RepID=UPI001B887427|nr:centlein-like isoform X2 [Gigantopelta aegis]